MKASVIKIVILFLSILVCNQSLAQNKNSISGTVKDEKTGEELLGANVYLKGTHIGSSANEYGIYSIAQVPTGKFTLVCSMLNYVKQEREITVGDNANLKIDFLLKNDEMTFSEVVVTATRNEALVTSISVATEVLTTAKLAESNAKNVGEALSSIGGSLIKSYGALGSLQSISLRGSTDSQVLVLVDGQRLNNAQQASVDMSTIPIDLIDRIEVVKGGHAALYGSDAVGGVINIITKSMAKKNLLSYNANGTFGTYNTRVYNASVGQGIGNFDYFASYNRTQSDGNFEYTNLKGIKTNLVNADTKSDNIFLKTGYTFFDHSRLSAFHKYRESDNGSPGTTDYPNLTARSKIVNNHSSITYEGLTFGPVAFTLNTYMMRNEYRYINPEAWGGQEESIYNSNALGALIQVFTDLNEFGLLSYGYEFRQDDLQSKRLVAENEVPFIGNHLRNVHSFYFQNDWKYSLDQAWNLIIVPAVRLDNYPEAGIGSQLSPKVGITLSHNEEWRGSIRGNIGRVFRAPTYNDLYWPEDSWTVGNPNLKPEKGITYDFGFIAQFVSAGSWSIEATYFASKLEDLILWASTTAKWTPTNVANASITGLESKVTWRGFENLIKIQASYTNMSAKDDSKNLSTSGKYLIYRPKDKFDLLLNLNYGIASLNIFYDFVGKRFHDAANKIEMDSYSLINANIGVTPNLFGVNVNLRLEANNLGDKELQFTKGSPVPGREIRFSIGIGGSITSLN
ncbi:MAG: TonB-dependent receptor [Ignavibacteriales bacterium]|nr:TonB-dependent receptor [Ignavibacteriales bacterium]